VAGSGGVAANVTVLGNKIADTVDSRIDASTVKVGVTPTLGYNEDDGITAADYTITPGADLSLTAQSSAKIIAISAGFAASGLASLNALVVGNLIDNTVDASITNGSTVHVGGGVALSATDSSAITALGLSFAASGGLAGAIVAAKNDIGNTVSSTIGSSTVITSGDVSASATENASILSFVGGVAVSGTASAAPQDSGLVACAYPLATQDVPAATYPKLRAEFAGSRYPDLRTAGTAYVDLAVALLTARGTDGYQTVWFYQRLSAACANHER